MKRITALIIVSLIVVGIVIVFRTSMGTEILWNISNSGQWLLPMVIVTSLIDAINPCAFSVLLLTIAFLYSLGKLKGNVMRMGGFYILGIFIAYISIGLGLLQGFHLFNIPGFMGELGAILVILLGLINIAGSLWPSFPIRLKIPKVSHNKIANLMEKASIPTIFLLGVLVGLCEFPCTGGPYLMVIGLLYDQATYLSGFAYLILYNLLFILPLVLLLFIAGDSLVLDKIQSWRKTNMKNTKLISGIIMILLGAIILVI